MKDDIFKLRAVINKKNGQINLNLPKKELSKNFKDIIDNDPEFLKNKKLRFKFEGFE